MKKTLSLVIAIILAVSLCGCGSVKEAATMPSYASSASANGVYEMAPAAMGEEGFGSYDYAMPEPEVMAGKSGESGNDAPDADPAKIIYTADVKVETTEFDSSVEALLKMIEENGGYVESSSVNNANYSTIASGKSYLRSANYVLRIPAAAFDKLMSSLSQLGNVPSQNVYTENVSAQYYDTQARLKNYSAQEERLNELLEKANTVSEILEIENELTEVRYRIESLQTTLNSWDRQVSYSTVYLNLAEVKEYTPESKIGFGKQLGKAFEDGFELLKDFVLWLAEALPVLVVAGAIIVGIVALIRKCAGKRKEKKAKKKESGAGSQEPAEQK